MLAALVVLLGIASPHFLGSDNLLNVAQQSAINAILGIGLTFVIISAGIDLSVGSVLALAGLCTADLLVRGVPAPVAALAGVGLGTALGAVNGLVTTLGRIPPFISTLGMMLVARSVAAVYEDGANAYVDAGLKALSIGDEAVLEVAALRSCRAFRCGRSGGRSPGSAAPATPARSGGSPRSAPAAARRAGSGRRGLARGRRTRTRLLDGARPVRRPGRRAVRGWSPRTTRRARCAACCRSSRGASADYRST